MKEKHWGVYILLCADHTLYTGITDDLVKRLHMHRSGKGAKYTRGRGPLALQYWEQCEDHSCALKREYAIKHMTRADKLKLIALHYQQAYSSY